ncbi:hypothetical protein [Rouxiella chamberiensis]|uniref:Uncharacterized protein n=1 Tax=Rouxiella chamberiensis TaxID=1513468 RepID=A0ABY7HMZ7_9GAMM|nr:hypothetical protein [Rouxiella chamberiensis]WAT00754.1 hypothetical protein O1V66_18235 [Rouxiella chamberiensis]
MLHFGNGRRKIKQLDPSPCKYAAQIASRASQRTLIYGTAEDFIPETGKLRMVLSRQTRPRGQVRQLDMWIE